LVALTVAEGEEDKVLYIGLVGAGNLLEIVTVKRDGDSEVVTHGMPVRRTYENCCVRQVKATSDKNSGRSKTGIELTPDVLDPWARKLRRGSTLRSPVRDRDGRRWDPVLQPRCRFGSIQSLGV
jgi:hypothetical protein